MNKTIYISSIENIKNLPTNCIAIVINKNANKLDKVMLQHKKIKVKTANKLIPPVDIIKEYNENKNYELFKASYNLYLIKECTETLEAIYNFVNKTNKRVYLLTRGKTKKNNARIILAELFYKKYNVHWQEFKQEETEIMNDFRKCTVVYKYGERYEIK